MDILIFLLILTIVVLVHELGHFLFAKLFKVQVVQFAIGFGPRIFSRKGKDGVEYRINLFPLGGYVRMAGEDPTDTNHTEEEKKSFFYMKPAWQRFFIAFSGPLFSILFGYVFMAITCAIWGIPTIGIDRVDMNTPAYTAGLKPGDILYSVNGKRLFSIDEFSNAVKKYQRFEVTVNRNGGLLSLTVVPELFSAQTNLVLETTEILPELKNKILLSVNGAPFPMVDLKSFTDKNIELMFENGDLHSTILRAFTTLNPQKMIGIVYSTFSRKLKDGIFPFEDEDEILSINGIPMEKSSDFYPVITLFSFPQNEKSFYNYIELKGDKVSTQSGIASTRTIVVSVLRQGNRVELKMAYQDLTQALNESLFYPAYENAYPQDVFHAFWLGIQRTNIMLGSMGEIIANLFTGKASVKDFAGPIGLVNIIGQASRAGIETVMFILAFITLNLGLINLLPLPALDGGRIVFSVVEMITRKKINPVVEGYIHTIGFFLLIAFAIYVSYYDVIRFLN